MPETLAQEYRRLISERGAILRAAQSTGADRLSPEQQEAMRPIRARLTEIDTIPPQGYALPKAATDFLEFAKAHGWLTGHQWTSPDYDGEPFVRVQVAHRLPAQDAVEHRSDVYDYQLTWHSRDCAPGKVKRFGSGLAKTPDSPQWHDAPSIKAIRAVIEQHPAIATALNVAQEVS